MDCNADCHCLLQPARDDTLVDGSRLVSVRSTACNAGEGRKPMKVSSGGGGEWREVVRVCSGERMERNICGVGWVSMDRVQRGGRARVPHIWVEYEGC